MNYNINIIAGDPCGGIAHDPAVKAIVASGYFSDPVMADFKKYGFSGVIEKPYGTEDLIRVLQNLT